jgi:hypothetical protein
LDAPIVPGKSAAGISLGDNINDILLLAAPFTIRDWSQGKCYQFGSVIVWANGEGKVQQVGLYPGYTGKIAGTIGNGSTIGEIIALLGVVVEDEEDNLMVQGLSGVCFESSEWHSLQSATADPAATVREIFIFEENDQRLDNPKYPTACPQCGREMQFDLILKDRRGVNSLHVSPVLPEDILGYGFYCHSCHRGWTGDELLKMAEDKGGSSA